MDSSGQGQILWVDDSQDICELFEIILSHEGFEVESAQSVSQGLQAARTHPFHLYLIDLMLPDGDGLSLIEKIQIFDPATPIVVYSGDVRQTTQDRAMQAGARAFIRKPVKPQRLLALLMEILEDERANYYSGDLIEGVVGGRGVPPHNTNV